MCANMKFLTVAALFVVLGSASLAESKNTLYNEELAKAHEDKHRYWGVGPAQPNPVYLLEQILEAIREIQEQLNSLFGNEANTSTTTEESDTDTESTPTPFTDEPVPSTQNTFEPSAVPANEKSHSKNKSHGKNKNHAEAHHSKSKHHAKEHAKSHNEKKN